MATHEHYYVPAQSKWPIIATLGMLTTVFGLATWFNDLKAARPESHGPLIFFVGGLLLAYMLFGWFGAVIKEISLPNMQHAIPAYYVIAPAEASSNLSRFDGVRFGYRCENPKDLTDLYKRSRGEGFGAEVQRRIMVGAYALSAGYYDAYYLKAQKIRRLIKNDFMAAFEEVDVILGPTAPNLAWKIGAKTGDPIAEYLEDLYTITANLAGLPGLSMPAGFVDGLPVGVQLLAPYFQEGRLLNVAHQYQLNTDWHTRTPTGF